MTLSDPALWDTISVLIGALISVMTVINTAAWFVLRAVFVTRADLRRELSDLADTLAIGNQNRIGQAEARLEARFGGMASAEELSDVKISIARVEGTVSALTSKIDGLAAVIARLEQPLNLLVQHHLNEGRS